MFLTYLSDMLAEGLTPLTLSALSLVLFRLWVGVQKKLYRGRLPLLILMVLYLNAMYTVTGLPTLQHLTFQANINLIPFSDFQDRRFYYLSFLNILMTVPLGMLLPLCWDGFHSWKNALMAGVLTALTIEILQLFCYRATDIDDVIFNTLGTMLGYLLMKCLFGRNWQEPPKVSCTGYYALNAVIIACTFFLREPLGELFYQIF